MKLFLDDIREFPESGYQCVRDAKTAKMLLGIMKFDFVTLDYDLGTEEDGLDVLMWMKENNVFVPHINIHSDHSIGRWQMNDFCQENFPNSTITMNSVTSKPKKGV